jgi:hypothetical protein
MENKIHHIQSEILGRVIKSGTLMSNIEKVNERSTNGIIIASTWGNVLPEDTHKLII